VKKFRKKSDDLELWIWDCGLKEKKKANHRMTRKVTEKEIELIIFFSPQAE
jgi:hypothetical protein